MSPATAAPIVPDPAPIPANERERLQAVEDYRLAGTGREPAFDRLTDFAAELFDVPMALINIIGADIQCMRGATGVDLLSTTRDIAICAHTIMSDRLLVLPDISADQRFCNFPHVGGEPHLRFYAGAPLLMDGQFAVGSLCLLDTRPRAFSARERALLERLARNAVDVIALRVERFAAEQQREEVAKERQRLSHAIGHLAQGVALFDRDSRLALWNEAFARLLGAEGLERGAAAGALFAPLRPHPEAPDAPDALAGLVAAQSPVAQLDLARADGTILDARRQATADEQFVVTLRDVTAARQTARLKDELVSTVSHELRTPLTAITGTLELLGAGAAGGLPDKAGQLIGIAAKNAERLRMLVDDLLDMDKLQAGKMRFDLARCELAPLLREAEAQNRFFAQRFEVSLRLALPEEDIAVRADASRLLQVLANLLSNAAKFSPRGGTVLLSLEREGEAARISVSDQGPGVPLHFRERLFTRFAQAPGERPAGHTGTGLGLAISKAIVEAHGGTIALEEASAPGDAPSLAPRHAGATFAVRLPLAGPADGA